MAAGYESSACPGAVGLHFWRCFASSFYRDTDAVVTELLDTLSRMGIEPVAKDGRAGRRETPSIEHTTDPISVSAEMPELGTFDLRQDAPSPTIIEPSDCIAVGDKVVLLFSDDIRRRSVRLVESKDDLQKGHLSIASPLGKAVLGAEEGDEVEFRLDDGRQRKALVESVEKVSTPSAASSETDSAMASI